MTSTRVKQSVLLVGMLLAAAQGAHAQTCNGFSDLKVTSRSVSTFAGGVGAERLALGRFGVASPSVFGGVQAGYGGRSGLDNPQTVVLGLDAGLTVPLGSTGVEICPLAQSLYERGQAFQGSRNHNLYNAVGLSIGRAITFGRAFAVVPFVDARLLAITRMHTGTGLGQYSTQGPDSYTLWGGQYTVGLGLRFNEVLTIRPAVGTRQGFPGFEDQGAMSISASYNFRR